MKKKEMMLVNKKLLENLKEMGVKNLINFGFMNVTKENILTDEVYCFFFSRFLNSLKGKDMRLDNQIELILSEIKN